MRKILLGRLWREKIETNFTKKLWLNAKDCKKCKTMFLWIPPKTTGFRWKPRAFFYEISNDCEKNRLPGHSGSHFAKHLMKPASRFRFTGTPPASGLSWITDFTFTLINIHCNSLIVNRLLNYFCNKILTFAARFGVFWGGCTAFLRLYWKNIDDGGLLWLKNYGRLAKNVAAKKMRMPKSFAIRANKKGVNIGVISRKSQASLPRRSLR